MEKLLFGISGLPLGKENDKFTYASGIEYLYNIGLDAMELPFVRSVNVTNKNKDAILEAKERYNFYLSAHGSYFINLNAVEDEKKEKSLERIINGAEALHSVNGRSLIFHPGFYLKSTKEDTLKEINTCKLCIDFSHIHARNNGSLKTYEDFAEILQKVRDGLGQEALDDLHVHISGIAYTAKGEKNHLPLQESDFNYEACLQAFIDYDVKGCVICESPILENDALLLKKTYLSLKNN